jgi:hypothetical protein
MKNLPLGSQRMSENLPAKGINAHSLLINYNKIVYIK